MRIPGCLDLDLCRNPCIFYTGLVHSCVRTRLRERCHNRQQRAGDTSTGIQCATSVVFPFQWMNSTICYHGSMVSKVYSCSFERLGLSPRTTFDCARALQDASNEVGSFGCDSVNQSPVCLRKSLPHSTLAVHLIQFCVCRQGN